MSKVDRKVLRLIGAVKDAVPHTWLDPLLTGPKAVIGEHPFSCKDIENLLNAIRERIDKSCTAAKKGKRK